jgi:hypothetical protein
MPDRRRDIREAARLIELEKNTKDPKSRAEILDLAEACLAGSVEGPIWQREPDQPVVQQQQQVQPRAKKER